MKKEKKLHGVIVPVVTPFTEEGEVDESAAVRIIDHLVQKGTYPFLLGTTGEMASISFESRLKLVKCVTKHLAGRVPLCVGISDNCLQNSLNAAHAYDALGVDAFVAHLPCYYPLSPDHMLKYYELLAEKSPRPIIIYNILSTTHMSIPLDVIGQLSHHPNIMGLKDSERDLDRIHQCAERFADRPDFSITVGWSGQSAHALSLGFDGIVPNPANLMPKMYQALYDAAFSGDVKRAEELQVRTDVVANFFQKDKLLSVTFAYLKFMMSQLGLCGPYVLPPLKRLTKEEEAHIRAEMEKHKEVLL